MTETEAREKWCPFVREAVIGQNPTPASYNRFEGKIMGRCIASDCMAWRWRISPDEAAEYRPNEISPRGYCGLAGSPNFTPVMMRNSDPWGDV